MPRYATIAELDAYLGRPAPEDATRLIDRASVIVAANVRRYVATDATTLLPTDATEAAALRDAVCAQIEQWLAGGDSISENTEQTIDGVVLESIGGSADPLANVGTDIAPAALTILRSAGLTGGAVAVGVPVWPYV